MPCETVNNLWERSVLNYSSTPLLSMDGLFLSYGEVGREVLSLGSALAYIGVCEGEHVAIIGENSPVGFIASLAVLGNRGVVTPLGVDYTASEIEYILRETSSLVVFLDSEETLLRYRDVLNSLPFVEALVVLSSDFCGIDDGGKIVFAYEHLLQIGEDVRLSSHFKKRLQSTLASDPAFSFFSAGTTGSIKGVVSTHQQICKTASLVEGGVSLIEYSSIASLLPMWHPFSIVAQMVAISKGCQVYYLSSGISLSELKLFNPATVVAFPQLWEKLYGEIVETLSGEKFDRVFASSRAVLKARRQRLPISMADRLRDIYGHIFYYRGLRSRIVGSGFKRGISCNDHLPNHIEDLFTLLKLPIVEIYSLAESAGAVSIASNKRSRPYSCGHPLDGTSVQIRTRRGRVCSSGEVGLVYISGDRLTTSYLEGERLTNLYYSRDESGDIWLKSGDVGYLKDDGDLVVLGRSSSQIALSTGEILQPESLEAVIGRSSYIKNVVLFAHRDHLCALIVPSEKALSKKRLSAMSDRYFSQFLKSEAQGMLCQSGVDRSLSSISIIRPLSIEDGTVTHSGRVRRFALMAREASAISNVARELDRD